MDEGGQRTEDPCSVIPYLYPPHPLVQPSFDLVWPPPISPPPFTMRSLLTALMMEAVSTSEMSVNFYETTQSNIPEGSHLLMI
jgi:hypothetical protein